MFCKNCGKVVDGESAFCTWCGAKISIPAEEQQPVYTAAETPTAQPEQSVPESVPEQPEPAAQEMPYEQPSPEPSAYEQPQEKTGISWGAEVPLSQSPQPTAATAEKPVKYYTGTHIALCLVTAGIMAAAAGVFAALYFSVIL